MRDVAVLIPAGGVGARLGGRTPKQFLRLGREAVLVTTIRHFRRHPRVAAIVVAAPAAHVARARRLLGAGVTVVAGGAPPRGPAHPPEATMTRVGFGFDLHPLVAGRPLVLGGVTVPSEAGLDGHSDADVLSHAVAEALLGALALGDLGRHFPDTDPRWRGVSSLVLLKGALDLVAARGARLVNVDASVLAQAPKLAPLLPEMAKRLADTLGIGVDAVSVKAKSPEGLGLLGRREGIAAMAVVSVEVRAAAGGEASL